ncbi:hypothetical protein BCV70DRAFT_154945, partial [Testicularia cyperi]
MSAHPSDPVASATASSSGHGLSTNQLDPKSSRSDLTASGEQPFKRKRPQSCDTCRSRKIKCVRLQVEGLEPGADNRCVQCRAIDAKCTFDYIPKRPGPQSSFAKTARREAEAQAKARAEAQSLSQSQSPAQVQNFPHAPSSSLFAKPAAPGSTPSTGGYPTPSTNLAQSESTSNMEDNWYQALTQQGFAGATGATQGTQTRSASWNGAAFDSYLSTSMMAMTPQFGSLSSGSPFDSFAAQIGSIAGPSSTISARTIGSGTSSASETPGSLVAASPWQSQPRTSGLAQSQQPIQPSSHPQQQQRQHLSSLQDIQFVSPSVNVPFAPASSLAHEARSASAQIPLPSFSRAVSPVPTMLLGQIAPGSNAKASDMSVQPEGAAALSRGEKRKRRSGPSMAKMCTGPILRPRSLDDIAPRQTFLSIFSLYFHYLWPLLPIVDRPSFSHDVLDRRDERDETFLAFLLSLTSYTLIQCPRTVIPAPWSVYRKLHRICHLTSRRMQPRTYDVPQLLHVNTLYCDHIYLGTVGKTNAANAVLGEAVRVAFTLGLHDERRSDPSRSAASSHLRPAAVNAVERELRKRMFWTLHGSSTTIALLQDEPAFIHDTDMCLDLPLAVDEEALVTPIQIQRRPSILCGFLTVTRLHQIMLELLEAYRRERRFPLEDVATVRFRFSYLADAARRITRVMEEMPEELRRPAFTHSPPAPIRRPGSAMPRLDRRNDGRETVSQSAETHAPPIQAIGFDAATQTALGDHLSGRSAWPWPADAFTREGLPNADVNSSTHSSARQSPRNGGDADLGNAADGIASSSSLGSDPMMEGAQAPHQVLTLPAMTPFPATRDTNMTGLVGEGLSFMDQINVFRPSPPPTSTPILSPMCTMYANIVVTESLIRFLLTEYRELLLSRARDIRASHSSSMSSSSAAVAFDGLELAAGEGWQDATANMLQIFNSMPLEALASNGHSLISKIVYVVSSLLNRISSRAPTNGYHYMSSLLAMLNRLSQTRKDDSASPDNDNDDEDGEAGNDDGE